MAARHWIRLVLIYGLVGAILLVCGGELGWWQGWLYAVLLFIGGVGGHVWAELSHPGLIAERQSLESAKDAKGWDKVLGPLMAFSLVFPMAIVAGLDHRYGRSSGFPLWLAVVGFVMVAFGYWFASWAVAENRFFTTFVRIQTERGHTVCDTGPYRFVRHPGYAGNVLPLFGIVLALGSVWTLLPAVVATILTVIRTELEDRALQAELPGYTDYAERVRWRLAPGLY